MFFSFFSFSLLHVIHEYQVYYATCHSSDYQVLMVLVVSENLPW